MIHAFSGTSDGQRWTIALVLVLTAVLVRFGLRESVAPRPVAVATPRPSVVATPPSSSPVASASPQQPRTARVSPSVNAPTGGGTQAQPPPAGSTQSPAASTGPAIFARIGSPGVPSGIAVSADGLVYVTTDNGTAQGVSGPSKVFAFSRTAEQIADITIVGQPQDHAQGLSAAAVDPTDGSINAIDLDSFSIVRIDPTSGAQTVETTIPDIASCVVALSATPCEPGLVEHAPLPSALAFDGSGNLYIADAGQSTIWRWRYGQPSPEQWYQSTDLATGDGPSGLAFDPAGNLLFTAGMTLDPSNPAAGGLYRLEVKANGAVGARTLVASFASDRPGAIAVDPSGVVYAILRASGTIGTVKNGTAAAFSTSGSPIPLDGPSGLAIHDGRLLVTNTAASDETRWAVLSFPR